MNRNNKARYEEKRQRKEEERVAANWRVQDYEHQKTVEQALAHLARGLTSSLNATRVVLQR